MNGSLTQFQWPDPAPLTAPEKNVPALTAEMLPQPIADFVDDIAQRLSISLDLPAGAVLAMVGAAIGRSIQIQPQAPGNPWTIPPNLWCCLIAESGWGKSPVISAALKPLFDVQAGYDEQNSEASKTYDAEVRRHKRLERAADKDDADSGGPPEQPPMKRLYTNNATFEALHAVARENSRGLLLMTDELPKFWDFLDAPANSQTKGHFLQTWNGNDAITLDRVIRGQNLSAIVCLSQLGGAQPDLVRRYVRSMKGDGWIQRYGLMVYPNLSNKFTVNRTAENRVAREAMDRLIANLCKLRGEEIRVIPFDTDAQTLYEGWLVPLVNRQRFSDEHPALVTHFTKYQSLMPQLALLFEIAADPEADRVTAKSTDLALRWVTEYLDKHAKRVYNLSRPGGESAYHLAIAIKERRLESHFTVRDVRQKHWRGLGKDEEITDAIDALTEWGWLRAAQISGTGRPTTKYEINPKLSA
jgi:putative DNA primase/helicase